MHHDFFSILYTCRYLNLYIFVFIVISHKNEIYQVCRSLRYLAVKKLTNYLSLPGLCPYVFAFVINLVYVKVRHRGYYTRHSNIFSVGVNNLDAIIAFSVEL